LAGASSVPCPTQSVAGSSSRPVPGGVERGVLGARSGFFACFGGLLGVSEYVQMFLTGVNLGFLANF